MYGQMNEPPGARARVALSGLTVAEYFRDKEGQDVLLFIDNIFRLIDTISVYVCAVYIYLCSVTAFITLQCSKGYTANFLIRAHMTQVMLLFRKCIVYAIYFVDYMCF